MPIEDAFAGAAQGFGKGADVAAVSADTVAADWSYDGEVKLDEQGEFFVQRRHSPVMTVTSHGVEVQVAGSTIRERRKIRPGKEAGVWKQSAGELDVAGAERALADLEERHLGTVQADGAVEAVLADFEAELPAGFEVTDRSDTGLTAKRVETQRNEVKGGVWASWDARVTLTVAVETETSTVTVNSATEHRISTAEQEGTWEPASTTDKAISIDWLARALRRGMPEGRERYGPALLPAVADAAVGYSEPPAAPPLRTMADIEHIITERAWTTSTGNFTVCLDRVAVNSTSSSGQAWDVPSFSGSTNPDITGSVIIANRQFPIAQADDRLSVEPKACATGSYRAGAPAVQVRIEDVDLTSNDTIASCPVDLASVAADGDRGVPCGSAQFYMRADYNFSFAQIEVVGLPPPDTGKAVDVVNGIAMANRAAAGRPISVYVLILNPRELAVAELGETSVMAAETAESLGLFSNLGATQGAEGNSLYEAVYMKAAENARQEFAAEKVNAVISVVHLHFPSGLRGRSWQGTTARTAGHGPGTYHLLKITIPDPIGAAVAQSSALKGRLGSAMAPSMVQKLVRDGVEQNVTVAMRDRGGQVLMVQR